MKYSIWHRNARKWERWHTNREPIEWDSARQLEEMKYFLKTTSLTAGGSNGTIAQRKNYKMESRKEGHEARTNVQHSLIWQTNPNKNTNRRVWVVDCSLPKKKKETRFHSSCVKSGTKISTIQFATISARLTLTKFVPPKNVHSSWIITKENVARNQMLLQKSSRAFTCCLEISSKSKIFFKAYFMLLGSIWSIVHISFLSFIF